MIKPLRATDSEFKKFQDFVQNKLGLKFPEAKKSLLESRLSTHIQKLGFSNFDQYFEYVMHSPNNGEELDFLVDKLTTHTTSFFREKQHFQFLVNEGIKKIAETYPKPDLKIASLGSSTGEEMYTISMVMTTLLKLNKITNFTVDAADISKAVLLKAKEGVFKFDHYESIPDRYKNLFEVKENKLFAKETLKSHHRFFMLNICKEKQKFPDKYHIVFCRNTLIYFSKELQQKVIDNVKKILLPGGLFLIGHSESLYGLDHSFERIGPTIYLRGKND